MYDLLVALLVWLSASSAEIDVVAPRASSCASAAYVSMLREPIEEQETCDCEEDCKGQCDGECCESCECKVDKAGGGEPPAPVKKRVVRCVNGRCYITYE